MATLFEQQGGQCEMQGDYRLLLIENVFIPDDVAFDNIGLRLFVFENFTQLTLFPRVS